MTTVLAPLNQAIQPYVFRGGGGNNKDNIKNVSPSSMLMLKSSSSSATTNVLSEGGLEMIYEETAESPHQGTARIRQNCMIGNGNNTDLLLQQSASLSPSPSILRRSRSLPQEEFRILGTKLCELQRHDSILSGKSGR